MREISTKTTGRKAALALAACLALGTAGAGARPVPGPALLERMKNGPEILGIVHFGLNTFTDREWGYGDADPKCFNPAKFDAGRIVAAAKAGGIGGLVIVAKHHDGFCLWPTKTTDYNIGKSPFRDGKGDCVREFADACRREGVKFGVYVSPWDRHDEGYATPRYVERYHAQIKELLGGGYGPVFEMWFDGANGGDGWYGGTREKRRIGSADDYYRFDEVFRFVRALQPSITIFAGENDASDFRWPGNERGVLSPSSRATIETVGGFANHRYGNPNYPKQINTGAPGGDRFRVCEADFPLRRGWFWHEKERGSAKNAAYLAKLYCSSVGNGGTMNIGLSPNRDGLLDEEDARALAGFSVMRAALFADEVRENGKPFNVVVMREDISKGENVDGWRFAADGKEILSGTSIGAKRIRLLPEAVAPASCGVEITAGHGPVECRRYFADPSLVKAILEAKADGRETDTAKWMTAGRR